MKARLAPILTVAATTVKKLSGNSPIKRASRRRCERKQTPRSCARETRGRSWVKTVEDAILTYKQEVGGSSPPPPTIVLNWLVWRDCPLRVLRPHKRPHEVVHVGNFQQCWKPTSSLARRARDRPPIAQNRPPRPPSPLDGAGSLRRWQPHTTPRMRGFRLAPAVTRVMVPARTTGPEIGMLHNDFMCRTLRPLTWLDCAGD